MSLRSRMAAGVERKWHGTASVTQLLKPTREAFLTITKEYTVNPFNVTSSMIGTSFHAHLDKFKPNGWLAAIRLENDICSGEFDAFDMINGELWDEKAYGAYKTAKALGLKEKWIFDGVYKTGEKKGKNKFKKAFVQGVRDIRDVAIQLNFYRILLEAHGVAVNKMKVEMFIREGLNSVAKGYGLTKAINIIEVNKISDHWITRFMQKKKDMLFSALETNILPPVCKDRWSSKSFPDRKCHEYCSVNMYCDYFCENYM